MALEKLTFTFEPAPGFSGLPVPWVHSGVVGSGDLEVLLTAQPQNGAVTVRVATPVTGFGPVWQKVLEQFVAESKLGDVDIDINDNNATPFIASMRLRQAVIEAQKGGDEA